MKKYKGSVFIETTACKIIGEIEFDSIEEYRKKAEELWESQDYDYPTTNVTNDFELNDWEIGEVNESYLKYYEQSEN